MYFRAGNSCIVDIEIITHTRLQNLKVKKINLYLLDFEKLTANQKSDKFAFNQWENREITYIHCVHPKSRDQADSEKKLKVPTVDIKIKRSDRFRVKFKTTHCGYQNQEIRQIQSKI